MIINSSFEILVFVRIGFLNNDGSNLFFFANDVGAEVVVVGVFEDVGVDVDVVGVDVDVVGVDVVVVGSGVDVVVEFDVRTFQLKMICCGVMKLNNGVLSDDCESEKLLRCTIVPLELIV